MRCRLCRRPAGLLRRRCRTCLALWAVYESNLGAPLHYLLPLLAATGAGDDHLRDFLAADPDGQGALEDRIAAAMTNQLFESFGGTQGRQTADDVRRLRRRGTWRSYGEPPE